MRCGLERCSGAKSIRLSIIPVVSFSHAQAISSRLQCNTADLPSGRWVPTLSSQYHGYQRKQSIYPWTSNDSCVLLWFWRWYWIPLHWLSLCFRITRKYPSFIKFNKFGSFSMRCKRSKHNSLRRSFCSSDSSFGTICAQTFLTSNSSLRIRRTLSLSKLTSSATARTPNLRSFSNHISHFFNVVIGNSCAWTAWAIIIFQAFSAFRKSFVPFKHACTRHAIFTVSISQ